MHAVFYIQKSGGDGKTQKLVDLQAQIEMHQKNLAMGVPPRGALGSRFSRAKDGGQDPNYVGDNREKEKFRRDWVACRLGDLVKAKERIETMSNINEAGGKYLTYKQIVDKEKDDLAATQWCDACKLRGGDWVRQCDVVANCETYWYVQTRKATEKRDSWSLHDKQTWSGTRDGPSSSGGGGPQSSSAVGVSVADGGKGNGKDKGGNDGGANGGKPKKGGKPGTHGAAKSGVGLNALIQTIVRSRAKYEEAFAKSVSLGDTISHEKTWAWANNNDVLRRFNKAVAKFTGRASDTRLILALDAKGLRNRYVDKKLEDVTLAAKSFTDEIDPLVSSLNHEMACLRVMHGARQAQIDQKGKDTDTTIEKPSKRAKH